MLPLNKFPVYSTTGLIALNKGNTVIYTLNNIRDFKKYQNVSSFPTINAIENLNNSSI